MTTAAAIKTPKGVKLRKLATLLPYAQNPKLHSDEQVEKIVASIQEFGFTNPVLIAKDGEIIAGHGRILGAAKLEMEEVPVLELGWLTDAQKRAYRIADNKLAEAAEWSPELLRLELQALDELHFDLDLTGFNPGEVRELIFGPEPPGEFPEVDETIATEHQCPRCGYRWSGGIHKPGDEAA